MKPATGALLFAFVMLVLLVNLEIAEAAVPKLITVQGRLRNATTQVALSGDYNMTFRIYTAASGGTAIYTEEHRGVNNVTANSEGIFQTVLGSITTLDLPFDVQYFLELNISNEVLVPRHSLTSAPYAYRANISTDVDCTGCVNSTDITDSSITSSDIKNQSITAASMACEYYNASTANVTFSVADGVINCTTALDATTHRNAAGGCWIRATTGSSPLITGRTFIGVLACYPTGTSMSCSTHGIAHDTQVSGATSDIAVFKVNSAAPDGNSVLNGSTSSPTSRPILYNDSNLETAIFNLTLDAGPATIEICDPFPTLPFTS